MVAHATIISSSGIEALAPSAAPPREYPQNAASARKIPAHPPQATGSHNSLTETKSFKPAEESKEGEQTKGSQCKGWHPPFQESRQENRAVDQKKIHAKAMEGGGEKKGGEYQEQLHMKGTVSLSFDPTHDISGEVISLIDDASWEVIDYPGGPA